MSRLPSSNWMHPNLPDSTQALVRERDRGGERTENFTLRPSHQLNVQSFAMGYGGIILAVVLGTGGTVKLTGKSKH